MNKEEKKKLCKGCRANRYNRGRGFVEREGIDAVVMVDECWHLATARKTNKLVYFSPGDHQPTLKRNTLSCWHNGMGAGEIVS